MNTMYNAWRYFPTNARHSSPSCDTVAHGVGITPRFCRRSNSFVNRNRTTS
nr:MAG TPA: hypothetical protein [Caudoviricetes sp.]